LKDAGADKVYLQECKIPHWVRGGKDEAKLIVRGRETQLNVLALGNSVSTDLKGITAPALLINSWDELERRKNEVKGKIVFYNYKFNPRFVHVFRAYLDARRYREDGASRAAKYGALATIVRSMSESTNNYPHTGGMEYMDSFPKIPTFAVGLMDADKLAIAIQQYKDARIFVKTNAHALPDTVGYNVIGELTGSEFPDQIITVGGHLDSWDPAEGAHDDGAGCVHSIEVLRAFKAVGYHPKHTIRIVLFSDEENKSGGSAKYIEEAKKEKHVFALESDGGGFTPRGFSLGTTKERLEKMRQWIPLMKPYGVYEFTADGGGADVDSLNIKLGIPVGELMPDSQRYFDLHHAANDVFENVNKRELELGAVNMAALIYLVDKYGL
jgi:carboxypeptidase Q